MRKTVLILGSAALASLFTLAHGQAPAPRAADAPPLVALTPERDGNFRIAPPYVDDPAFTEKAGVSKGTVHRFTMNSADSKIYPTPVEAGIRARAQAGQQGATPAEVFVVPVAEALLEARPPRVIRGGANSTRVPLLKKLLPAAAFDRRMTAIFGLDRLKR